MTATLAQRHALLFTMLGFGAVPRAPAMPAITRARRAVGALRRGAVALTLGVAWLLHRLVSYWLGADAVLARAIPVLVCTMVIAWLIMFSVSAMQLNSPAHAKLVPHARQRLVRSSAAAVALCALVAASVVATGFGVHYFGCALAIAGFVLTLVLASHRHPILAAFVPAALVSFVAAGFMLDGVVREPLKAIASQPALIAAGFVADVLLLAIVLRRVFPQAGDAHMHWNAVLRQQMDFAAGRAIAPNIGKMARMMSWLGLGRKLRSYSSLGATRRQGRMLWPALGVQHGYARVLLPAILPLLIALGLFLCGQLEVAALRDFATTPVWMMCCMLPALLDADILLSTTVRSAGEQSLYRLSPAAPPAQHLNRLLAAVLLKRFMLVWLVSLALMITHFYVTGGTWHELGLCIAYAAAMLPCASRLLGNHGALVLGTDGIGRMLKWQMMLMAGMGAGILGMLWLNKHLPWLNWWWVALVIATASGVLLRWRWLGMMACAPALPAGYLQR